MKIYDKLFKRKISKAVSLTLKIRTLEKDLNVCRKRNLEQVNDIKELKAMLKSFEIDRMEKDKALTELQKKHPMA